jgi:hypothetical protein
LSIDEIWSFEPESAEEELADDSVLVPNEAAAETEEEQVVFNDTATPTETPDPAFQADEGDGADKDVDSTPAVDGITPPDSVNGDYDFLDDGEDLGDDVDNPELDELEAEILRELED